MTKLFKNMMLSKIKNKFLSTKKMKVVSIGIFILVGVVVFFSANYFAKGATYGWIQANWNGGVDTSAVASHENINDRTIWDKYYSKYGNLIVDGSNDLTLSGSSAGWIETDDEDFNAGEKNDFYVSGGGIKLKKPNGASCSVADECFGGFCTGSICASS